MGQAWVVVMQVLFICLLFIPGVKGVYSWYLLISQVPPWLLWIALERKINAVHFAEFEMTIFAAWAICLATVVLAFVFWARCKAIMDCTASAVGAAATLVVALGLALTNLHMLRMARKASSVTGGEPSAGENTNDTNTQQLYLRKKTK